MTERAQVVRYESGPARPNALSKQQTQQFKQWVVALLGKMALERQAEAAKEVLMLYAARLVNFEQQDIWEAVEKITLTRREPGETAFPDVATVIDAVKAARYKRESIERQRKRDEESAERERERQANGEAQREINRLARIAHPGEFFRKSAKTFTCEPEQLLKAWDGIVDPSEFLMGFLLDRYTARSSPADIPEE